MGSPYVGEVRMFGGSFPPANWMFCDGTIIAIAENETLFNLIGTTYGGDGQSTFAVPDLRGRLPVHQGPGFVMGQLAGSETVTLTSGQMPSHTHPIVVSTNPTTTTNPAGNVIATPATATPFFANAANTPLLAASINQQGGNQPHTNMQPYLCINFIISLSGIYPSPN